jgi:hypothetical protein
MVREKESARKAQHFIRKTVNKNLKKGDKVTPSFRSMDADDGQSDSRAALLAGIAAKSFHAPNLQ